MPSISWQETLTTNVFLGAGAYNIRMAITAAQLTASGNLVRVRFVAGTGGPLYITEASIAERSGVSGNAVATPVRLTFGGSNGVTIPAGTAQWSDWISFNLDETKDYLVHAYIGWNSYIEYRTGGYTSYYRNQAGEPDETFNITLTSGYLSDSNCYDINEIDVDTAAPPSAGTRRRPVIVRRRLF